ncbi:MAG: carbohydrate kinase family protein [Anaerolineaceae bacterium]|nr:carbohydrate kinase family protein [Anaerolineaceae bacterium]
MNGNGLLRYVIAGQLRRDYIITPGGMAYNDIMGGNLLYAACGLAQWDSGIGLQARIGEDYPQPWIDYFVTRGFDCRGITIIPKMVDLRSFFAYPNIATPMRDNPVSHYSRLTLPFPKSLLGYSLPVNSTVSPILPADITFRVNELPDEYRDATAAHICPMDIANQMLLASILHQGHTAILTLEPSETCMNAAFWGDIKLLVKGLTAFIVSEDDLRTLFIGRSRDLWQMAETIADFGCEIVVIRREHTEQYIYDHPGHRRWILPVYPARVSDPTGSGDAFGGGFLAGYKASYDPLEAAIHGNISASIAVEGTGPFYALDAMPGLAQARRSSLREMARCA